MSLSINPNSSIPNFTPTGPGPGGFTPLQKLLIDTFSPSVGRVIPNPSVDASNPQISMSDFFEAVSSAQLKQILQDYVNKIADPLIRQKLLAEIAERSGAIADLISMVVQYREALFRIGLLDLPGKKTNLNNAINDFNAGNSQDATQLSLMNSAITSYNTSQTNYQNALSSYQTALSSYGTAQGTYNTALNAWNTALNNYNNGTITQAQLQTAENTFNTAKNAFEVTAKGNLTTATNTFNTAKTNWQTAQTNLTSAASTYNAYATSRNADLSLKAQAYNTAVADAIPIIDDMNNIRTEIFGQDSLANPSNYTTLGLPSFNQGTPGVDTLRNQVQGNIDARNTSSTNMNTLIGQIASIIATINAGGYTPPLIAPPTQSSISDLPPENSNYTLTNLIYTPPTSVTFDPKTLTNFNVSFIDLLLAAVNNYNETSIKENNFQKVITDPLDIVNKANLGGGSVGIGSSVSVTANRVSPDGHSPHLLRTLSKEVFETIFNIYGVPIGSPLVDQLGALVYGYKLALDLLSLGPAKAILEGNALPGIQGEVAANAALGLGNIFLLQELVSSGQITVDVTKILNENAIFTQDPTLALLTPEAKAAFIQAIVQEIGASLIKAALTSIAVSLDLPGLVSQILANITSLTKPETKTTEIKSPPPPDKTREPPANKTSAPVDTKPPAEPKKPLPTKKDLELITLQVLIAQELDKLVTTSKIASETIVQDAIKQLAIKNQAVTRDAIINAILDQIRNDKALVRDIADRFRQRNSAINDIRGQIIREDAQQTAISEEVALVSAIKQSVIAADTAAQARVKSAEIQSSIAKRDAFLDSLARDLEKRPEVDPARARILLDRYKPTLLNALIGGLIEPTVLKALSKHLIELKLTPEDAGKVIDAALKAANAKDATINPLSTFIGGQVLGLPELSALFKMQVSHLLTPVIGERKALQVAEDYGRLIFAAPHSLTKILEINERNLVKLDGYDFNARVFEDYRNAAQIFINPLLARGTALQEGNVLLLSGQAAGLSVQGTTSADNKLGPLANRSKRAIDMPG